MLGFAIGFVVATVIGLWILFQSARYGDEPDTKRLGSHSHDQVTVKSDGKEEDDSNGNDGRNAA